MKKNVPIGQLLLSKGYITEIQLNRALKVQKQTQGKKLGDVLVELSYVSEKNLLECLSQRLNVQFIDILRYSVNKKAVETINMATALRFNMLPIDLKNKILTVATNDALDFYALDEIATISGYEVNTVLAIKEDITTCINKYYGDTTVQEVVDGINKEYETTYDDDIAIREENIEGTPVVRLVNSIITNAYFKGASDIHIECFKNTTVVRFRVDGDLIYHSTLNVAAHGYVVARLKILSGMNIAEKRLPQDGNFNFKNGNINVDIRVSSMPTIHGEKIVMRLLSSGQGKNTFLSIQELGLKDDELLKIEKMIKNPNGIIFVTGPTGSGKTTTLYAVLNELLKKNINIVTVEDPVEKPIEGVNQVQVNVKAGLTFTTALRSILRQDPDVIMIGEIRDGQTADIGVRAAITGHLVLATIHTNDAASTVVRAVDMGIEPYIVGAAISGIIAQRLVKIVCPHCKEEFELSSVQKQMIQVDIDTMYRSVGCQKCNMTGFMGRKAIYEIIDVDSDLRQLIARNVNVHTIREHAQNKGVMFLKDRILEMAKNGETTFDELEKIIYSVD